MITTWQASQFKQFTIQTAATKQQNKLEIQFRTEVGTDLDKEL
jgi:hypothetical protein